MRNIIPVLSLLLIIQNCSEVKSSFELPILGRSEVIEREENGTVIYDTLTHKIADFSFVDQDSAIITNETFQDQVYIADFFFTSCPTICPTMKQQMLRVYNAYKENQSVAFLSHSIDPEYDTVALLHDYADRLGVESSKWHFVTGDQDEIYEIGESSYMVVADEDPSAPGGFIHSGAFLLIDKERQIRGVYDGTIKDQVDILIKDIDRLLKTYAKD
ncbi:MAG: SCO family protein [Cyclobacteriaceae bacterium]|nr:SCO family protein [Cyclobacteriaceae bacterium HetDA_MAG_MS6]